MRLAAASSSTSPKPDIKSDSYGKNYNECLKSALNPVNVSFSLKPKIRTFDQSQDRITLYAEQRIGEIKEDPVSVLDAPGLRDDYYLNILDWSSSNVLAVALDSAVYIWDAKSSCVQLLTQLENECDYISALSFTSDGSSLSMANSFGCLSTFDLVAQKKLCNFRIHDTGRIACLATCPSALDRALSAGSKSGNVYHIDPRISSRSPTMVMQEHTLEVCGLKRNNDGHQLASGGNDNKVCIWDLRNPSEPLWIQSDHNAAIKALDWCPWQRNLLATGSGTADRRIRFWNTMTNSCLREIQCESQVCGLRWSASHSEIVSTHGYSNNELAIWHYPSLTKIKGITAHDSRVLQMTMSSDATMVVTAAANENLKFWELFPSRPILRRPRSLL